MNDRNRVIGVTYAIYNSEISQNLNYAINVKYLKNLYNALKDKDYLSLNSYNLGNRNYTVSTLNTFYKYTNLVERFETSLSIYWKKIFNTFDYEEKLLLMDIYEKTLERDSSWDVSEWEVVDYLRNIGDATDEEIVLIAADIQRFNKKKDIFKAVNDYELSFLGKVIALLTLGNHTPQDLNDSDNKDVVKEIDDIGIYDFEDKLEMLEFLGYKVSDSGNIKW